MWSTTPRRTKPPTSSFTKTSQFYFRKILQDVRRLDAHDALIPVQARLLVAVSGGPDSMALLWLLAKIRRQQNLSLSVAHVNHGILAKQAKAHEKIVRNFCEKLDLPFFCLRVHLPAMAKKMKRSLEDAGRVVRYRFFSETAKKIKADAIVTAHTLDDQAETMLMRLLRGAGPRGLSGIASKRKEGGVWVIRPLLKSKKSDLLLMLKEQKVPFALDRSNKNRQFLRNKIRHDLLPLLRKKFNPRIDESLLCLQAILSQTHDLVEMLAAGHYRRSLAKRSASAIQLKMKSLRDLHPALQREVLLCAILDLKGNLTRINADPLLDLTARLQKGGGAGEMHLARSLRLCWNEKFLTLKLLN